MAGSAKHTARSAGRRAARWVRRVVLALLAVVLAGFLGIAGLGYASAQHAMEEKPVEQALEALEASPDYVSFNELPQTYIWAVISVEDHRFFSHAGVDPIAIGRALGHDLVTLSFAQGGSTITQQIAKNEWFTQEKTIGRKAAEIWVAFEIERLRSKQEILAIYASTIYFGNNCYGLRAAARYYYGCEPSELTDEQCTMLAGLPNAPSVLAGNEEAATARQAYVERQMRKYGYA